MIPQEARDIIAALLQKTQAGEANWQRTRFAGGRDVFIDLGPYVVHVFEGREGAVFVRLKDDSGVELLAFSVAREDAEFGMASELLSLAHQHVMNPGGVLDDVRRLVLQAGPVG
ncbi:MAG TPA: hypothetical protein VFT45_17325 [Longimicrobium sp.]|nr:hypothetical protein [Longimicrobium sp.]